LRTTSHPEFQRELMLQDPAGCTWPVVYEASRSNQQYHRRLSRGWAEFCRHIGVKLNDTIEIRRCLRGCPNVETLAVRVLRHGLN
jgi:hypothetical protein